MCYTSEIFIYLLYFGTSLLSLNDDVQSDKMRRPKKMEPEKRKAAEVGAVELEFGLINVNDSMEEFLEK